MYARCLAKAKKCGREGELKIFFRRNLDHKYFSQRKKNLKFRFWKKWIFGFHFFFFFNKFEIFFRFSKFEFFFLKMFKIFQIFQKKSDLRLCSRFSNCLIFHNFQIFVTKNMNIEEICENRRDSFAPT